MKINKSYRTTWQKHKKVRYVLLAVKGDRVLLKSTYGGKEFWAHLNDLIDDNNKQTTESKEV